MVADRHRPGRGQHEVADVEVQVVGLGAGRVVEHVHVEVDGRHDHARARRCPVSSSASRQRHRGEVGVAVGVAARLEPALHLRVEQEQQPAASRVDDRGRAGEVALDARAVQGVGWASTNARIRARLASCAGSPGSAATTAARATASRSLGRSGGRSVRVDQQAAVTAAAPSGADRRPRTSATGRSAPALRPMRGDTAGSLRGRCAVVDDRDAAVAVTRSAPSNAPSIAEGLAQPGGPRQRSRSARAAGRRARIAQALVGTAARSSTATPSPSSPHTAFMHQCIP